MEPETKPRSRRRKKSLESDDKETITRNLNVLIWPEHDVALTICLNHLKANTPRPEQRFQPVPKIDNSCTVRWALLEMAKILESGILPDQKTLEVAAALNGKTEELAELTQGPPDDQAPPSD